VLRLSSSCAMCVSVPDVDSPQHHPLALHDALPIYTWLSSGELFPEKLEVQCPLHDSKFSFETGDPHQPPADKPVEVYAVKVEGRSEEHTSELQSRENLVCRLLLEKKEQRLRRNDVR